MRWLKNLYKPAAIPPTQVRPNPAPVPAKPKPTPKPNPSPKLPPEWQSLATPANDVVAKAREAIARDPRWYQHWTGALEKLPTGALVSSPLVGELIRVNQARIGVIADVQAKLEAEAAAWRALVRLNDRRIAELMRRGETIHERTGTERT